ncbi:hypothetical protein E1A91_A13G154600v1 [Gossypium mustelinum]|uniref:Potassium channel domain-containing protein n=1 Tax=Gossypium mustelinum TaxID=34275 RepID=A0A5D2WHZ1_GOSMU|nr:hypothetical protein E1A91_A13G154600v1 [Gossypium mustelinum]TYJ01455.1 hypothetical protein E1A91_A13G154600v1 [Gossypium mustelinum]
MLGHFNSIIAMAANAAKQTKLPMAATDSPNLTNDKNGPKKTTFQSCKATSVATNCDPRTNLPDLKWLGLYYVIYIDLVPHDFLSQVVCTGFITVGMLLFGIVVKLAAKYLVFKQQKVLINALHTARKMGPMEALNEIESIEIDYTKCIISLIAMAVHFVIGVSVLVNVEGMEIEDAVYCACTTMTTVGFGDESFSSEFGRMFGVLWIFTGTSCLGQLFLYVAEVYTDIEAKKLVKWVIASNIIDKKDFEAADNLEKGKVHGAADFILYKLKEVRKIKQEDISCAMKDAGVDDRSVFDVIPAQSSEKK